LTLLDHGRAYLLYLSIARDGGHTNFFSKDRMKAPLTLDPKLMQNYFSGGWSPVEGWDYSSLFPLPPPNDKGRKDQERFPQVANGGCC